MRSLAQNEMSLKNTEEKKISIQFSNEIKSSQYNFIKLPLELIVPRINYLDINELLQQQNVIFRRLLSALNIDRRHFSGSHAIARHRTPKIFKACEQQHATKFHITRTEDVYRNHDTIFVT